MPQIAPGSEVMTEEGMMVTRRSIASGTTTVMFLPITFDQLRRWRAGMLIQDAFPNLTNDQREFLMTSMTQAEWDSTMKDPDE